MIFGRTWGGIGRGTISTPENLLVLAEEVIKVKAARRKQEEKQQMLDP